MSLASYNDEYKLERRIKQRIPQMFDEHRYQIPNFEIEKKSSHETKAKQSQIKATFNQVQLILYRDINCFIKAAESIRKQPSYLWDLFLIGLEIEFC